MSQIKKDFDIILDSNIENLKQIKKNLPKIDKIQFEKNVLTKEQEKAVTSTEPLIIVKSGAGTGKTTTLKNRLKYLLSTNIKKTDIKVVTFTINMTETLKAIKEFKDLNISTNNAFIKEIFDKNYKTKYDNEFRLCDYTTLKNLIQINMESNKFSVFKSEFLTKINTFLDIDDRYKIYHLYEFVSKNIDEVINFLQEVGFVTFDLQTMILASKINELELPEFKHLLIDEVQDNAIFDNIFFLKYTIKNKNTLFLVGDPSQTLYEFRGADRHFITKLIESKVFKKYNLTESFRSNNQIIEEANKILDKIDVNQIDNMHLKTSIEEDSDVIVNLEKEPGQSENEYLKEVHNISKMFIENAIDKNETIAIIAYARANLTGKNSTGLLDLVKKIANEYDSYAMYRQPKSYYITKQIKLLQLELKRFSSSFNDFMESLTVNATGVDKKFMEFVNSKPDLKHLEASYFTSKNEDDIYENIFLQDLINLEIEYNDESKFKKVPTKQIYIGTIHSVKGLEFKNVIYVCNQGYNKNNSEIIQENYRLQYVAITRAGKRLLKIDIGN